MAVEAATLTFDEKMAVREIVDRSLARHQLSAEELKDEFFSVVREHPELQSYENEITSDYRHMEDAHDGATRRLGYERPYIIHTVNVALLTVDLLKLQGQEPGHEEVRMALKHDMVEDGEEKGITGETIFRQSGRVIADGVFLLTRHKKADGSRMTKLESARVIMEAHKLGHEKPRTVKIADVVANALDQPGVAKPLLGEVLLFRTDIYENSDWGRWRRTRRLTQDVYGDTLAAGDPLMSYVIDRAVSVTDHLVSRRPRRSILLGRN